ncbi:diacylglycerol kinase catalytic domain protein, partial [Ancylostoma caninum]
LKNIFSDVEEAPIGRLLVFVNPNSGSGKGVKTFRTRVEPELKKNHIDYELMITTGPNHAKTVVRSRDDLGKFNGVMILSGDGLVFEVINGLAEREDRATILPSLPIGIVPSGSGNGLLSSLFFSRGEPLKNPKFTERAIEISCSSSATAQAVNLIHVQTDRANMAAFLSVGWGLMADIDIESERWRKSLGPNRFVLGGLIRALNLRTYRGRLSYKPYVAGKRGDNGSYDIYARTIGGRMLSSPRTSDSTGGTSTHRALDAEWRSLHCEQVNDVEDEVSEDWTKIEEDFVSVYAVTLSHISNDGPFAPKAVMNDDRIYLTYILRKNLPSRVDLIKYLTSIEKQKHLDLPFVEAVEVSAFRLEPLDPGSYLVVDGEVVDAKKIQAMTTTLKTAIFAPRDCSAPFYCHL